MSPPSPSNRGRGSSGSKWCEYILYRLQREFGKTTSIQVIVISILLYSILSIILIYTHLVYFQETRHSRHLRAHYHPSRGRIEILSHHPLTVEDIDVETRYKLASPAAIDFDDHQLLGPPSSVNLLSSHLLHSSELSHRGWFNDHWRWSDTIHCFNSRWTLCDKVYSTKCRQDTIRAIYQYVPFKSNSNIRELFISLRATPEQLIEQTNDAFYGLLALIKTVKGEDKIVRIKFQYESEPWSLRTLNFHSDDPIFSVTIMLACYGYLGDVSFTDVHLTSPAVGPDPMFSWKDLGSWCVRDKLRLEHIEHKTSQRQAKKLEYESLDLWSMVGAKARAISSSDKVDDLKSSITLVTQISMDRLVSLERSLSTWTGPVSIVIYVPIKNASSLEDWHRLYIHKKISLLHLSIAHLNASTISMVSYPEDLEYPINQLRNLAMDKANTRWMFLIDGDFQSSPNLIESVVPLLPKATTSTLEAFVVPAFEYVETPNKDDPVIGSKDELIELIHREDHQLLQPFRQYESMESHSLTDYYRWYTSNIVYTLTAKYHDKYEPYVIVERRPELPRYRDQLTNYGMNKVLHATELFASGYKFRVLPNVWTIHFPHRTTGYYQAFCQNLDQRLVNRAQRFEIIEQIIWKYNRSDVDDCRSIHFDCN